MTHLPPPTLIERVADSPVTGAGLTLISTVPGAPVAALLLPILGNTLASGRYKQRVEQALASVSAVLEAHSEQLHTLTDSQFKLVNEAVLAILHTTSDEKLLYLRRAIQNSLIVPDLQPEEAVILARVIRDISAEEAHFLITNFSYKRIQVGRINENVHDALVVESGGRDEMIISGLTALGLILPAGPTMDDMGLVRFSNVVAKVIALLRDPTA
jgi:hypothetical protein